MQKAATDPPFFPKGARAFNALARSQGTHELLDRASRVVSRELSTPPPSTLFKKKKKKKKTPHQTGDPEDPDEESNVVSMSSDGRTPAVSDSARRSETTPSIAENT